MDLNILDVFKSMKDFIFIDAQIAPCLASGSLSRHLLSLFSEKKTLIVFLISATINIEGYLINFYTRCRITHISNELFFLSVGSSIIGRTLHHNFSPSSYTVPLESCNIIHFIIKYFSTHLLKTRKSIKVL